MYKPEQFHAAAEIVLAGEACLSRCSNTVQAQARDMEGIAMTDQDVFTTATAGLKEACSVNPSKSARVVPAAD